MTKQKLTTLALTAGLAVFLTACGQAPSQSSPQPASVSTSVAPDTPAPAPSTDDSSAPAGNGAVSRDRAVQIALGRTGGGDVDKVENEFEHGRTAWKVRVVKDGIRYSVYVDKANGDIIRFRDEGRH